MTAAASIHVRFSVPGWHRWPGAPSHRAYLANSHRHLFGVEVTMPVSHDDREVEFHDVRDEAERMFSALGWSGDMGPMSCEHMARALGDRLAIFYQRPVTVTVWEDQEFGSTVVAQP